MFIEKFINIGKRQMVLQCIEDYAVTGDPYIKRRVSGRYRGYFIFCQINLSGQKAVYEVICAPFFSLLWKDGR